MYMYMDSAWVCMCMVFLLTRRYVARSFCWPGSHFEVFLLRIILQIMHSFLTPPEDELATYLLRGLYMLQTLVAILRFHQKLGHYNGANILSHLLQQWIFSLWGKWWLPVHVHKYSLLMHLSSCLPYERFIASWTSFVVLALHVHVLLIYSYMHQWKISEFYVRLLYIVCSLCLFGWWDVYTYM